LQQGNRFTVVCDLQSVSWDCVHPSCISVFKQFLHIYEKYYPSTGHHILLLNAPSIMPMIWPVFSGLLPPEMQKQIHFLSTPEAMAQYIDGAQTSRTFFKHIAKLSHKK